MVRLLDTRAPVAHDEVPAPRGCSLRPSPASLPDWGLQGLRRQASPSPLPTKFGLSKRALRGEMLILTDDLTLVLSLRYDLLQQGYGLTWTNNFWIGMSYLHTRRFSSLIFDLSIRDLDEKFVPYFLDEYELCSHGNKVFISSEPVVGALERLVAKRFETLFTRPVLSREIVESLGLKSDRGRKIRDSY